MVWASDGAPLERFAQPAHEHLLPGGAMHLVFRLSDSPLRILDPAAASAQPVGAAMVGGVRSRYYIREMSAPSCSVGAVLRAGAAEQLFGVSTGALAERHTPLEDLWGAAARSVRDRLLEAGSGAARLAILEAVLAARLPRVRGLHPAIAAVLDALPALPSVEAAVQHSGLSHRRFIAQFRHAVGLAPKLYLRVLRFQRALRLIRQGRVASLAEIAAEAGYSDQAHFNREFLEFAGATPTSYLRRAPDDANHLPVEAAPKPSV